MKLNDVVVRTLSPPPAGQKTFYDDALPNFGLRVSQGGTRTFIVRHGLERHLITLGRYPLLSLAEARQLAREKLAETVLGKRHTKAVRWDKALEEYLEACRKKNRPGTVSEYERLIKSHFNFSTRLGEVDYEDIERKLKKLDGTPGERNHALTAVKIFLSWCVKPPRRYITTNPCTGLSPQRRPKRTRVLSDTELQLIWRACEVGESPVQLQSEEPRLPRHFCAIIKLLILTGQRRGEIAALQSVFYSHNQQTICLPGELTKNHRVHTFPVGNDTRKLLEECFASIPSGFLFPGKAKNFIFAGWGKAKRTLDELSGVTGWTLHDLRRTFKTNLSRLGVLPHISERLLNHVSGRNELEDTYDLYRYLPEMRKAIELWECHLQGIINGKEIQAA